MFEASTPFLQSELDYRAARLRAGAPSRRRRVRALRQRRDPRAEAGR